MKGLIILILFALFNWMSYCQQPNGATDTVDRKYKPEEKIKFMNIIVSHNDNYRQIPVKERNDISYDYAYQLKNKKLELWFSLFSWDYLNLDRNNVSITDASLYFGLFTDCFIMNEMHARSTDKINAVHLNWPEKLIAQVFNADAGVALLFENSKDFYHKSKYIVLVSLFKEKVGFLYVTIFVNDESEIDAITGIDLNGVKFGGKIN